LLFFIFIALCLVACNNRQKSQSKANQEILSEKDLQGKVVATLTGCSFEIDMAGRSDFKIVRQPTMSDCIASLRQGRVDAIVYDEVCFTEEMLREKGMKKAFLTEKSYPCAFACTKSNLDLVNKFNEFLAKLKSSGELNEITLRWQNCIDYTHPDMPETKDNLTG